MSKFILNNNGIHFNNNGEMVKIADPMSIKSIQQNIDEGTYKAIIKYKSFSGIKEITMPREDYLNKNNLIKYQSKGLDITHENIALLTQYFNEKEREAEIKNIHTKLGFYNYEGKIIYKLYECIGISSKYEGIYDVKPIGSKDEYIDMLNQEVIGNTALEFIVLVALSAVLLGYIGEDLGLDSIIFHLVGNSTTGKSTALKLAISLFGYPDVKRNGLFGTYNGTNNALIKKLTGLKGVPFALDEISMSYTQNFTNFIYAISNGTVVLCQEKVQIKFGQIVFVINMHFLHFLNSTYFHIHLEINIHNDCVFLLYYKMFRYIQKQVYMHVCNLKFYNDLTTLF